MLRVAATCHSSLAIFTMDGFPRCFRSPRSSLISLNFLPTSRSTLSRISNNQRSKSRRGSVKLSYRERYCVLTFKRRSSKSIRDLRSFKIGGSDTFPSILIVDYLSNDFTSSLCSRGEIESSCRRSKLRKWKLVFVFFGWLQIRKLLEYLLELVKLKATSLRNSSLELIINNKIIYKELFWSVEIQKKKKLIGWK